MTMKHWAMRASGVGGAVFSAMAAAKMEYDLQPQITEVGRMQQDLHVAIMWIISVIFVIVFGFMFYSLYAHRKSKGHKAATFHESTSVEIAWTVIPFLILLVMAWPATKAVLAMKDTSSPDLTIKVTGYQWKWGYDYIHDGFGYLSTLSTPLAQIEGREPRGENYLLEVDNPMVVPMNRKVRVLITANDVLHAWYVPALGVKQDAIPGFVRDAWFKAEKPGIYRGQCAELCGKEHGFMPTVVEVKTEADYEKWVIEQKKKYGVVDKNAPVAAPAVVAAPAAAAAPVEAAAVIPAAQNEALPAKLFFEVGKTDLPANTKAAVAAAVEFLKANASAKVALSGFVDKTGNADQNAELAKNRAKAVREALKTAGVDEARIEMRKPEVLTGAADNKEARRVEIIAVK
jgi:cytochrome c oxidase subunit II